MSTKEKSTLIAKLKLLIATITLGIAGLVGCAVFAPSAWGQTVEKAEAQPRAHRSRPESSHERDGRTDAQSRKPPHQEHDERPRGPEGLPPRLQALRNHLRDNIDELATTASNTLAQLDRERSLIADPVTRSAMRALPTQSHQQSEKRLGQARATLQQLDRVLV